MPSMRRFRGDSSSRAEPGEPFASLERDDLEFSRRLYPTQIASTRTTLPVNSHNSRVHRRVPLHPVLIDLVRFSLNFLVQIAIVLLTCC